MGLAKKVNKNREEKKVHEESSKFAVIFSTESSESPGFRFREYSRRNKQIRSSIYTSKNTKEINGRRRRKEACKSEKTRITPWMDCQAIQKTSRSCFLFQHFTKCSVWELDEVFAHSDEQRIKAFQNK